MAEHASVSSFLNIVRRSNLVDASLLDQVRNELESGNGANTTAQETAELLVDRSLLTEWQASLLLAGKYRGFRLGSYRLLDLIGKGGMGSVYLAQHDAMGRRCAIKVLPSSCADDQQSSLHRFHREAQAIASLDHPNIVRAYDLSKETQGQRDIHYLVMEYIEGRTIQAVVENNGPLSYGEAVEYLRQTARGLAHAHSRGFIHRDIKPSNLILAPDGKVKILDLGLVGGFFADESASLSDANSETLLGTADYVSPEQALGQAQLDEKTDLYSLGCVAYFMLTGKSPFAEGTVAERLLAHQLREPTPLAEIRNDIPKDLADIVHRMLAKKPSDRPQTAATIEAELTAWLDQHASEHVLSNKALSGTGSTIRMRSSGGETQILAPAEEDDQGMDDAETEIADAAQAAIVPEVETSGRTSNRRLLAVAAVLLLLVLATVVIFVANMVRPETSEAERDVVNKAEDVPPIAPAVPDTRFAQWNTIAEEIRNDSETLLYLSFTDPAEQSLKIANEALHSKVTEVEIHGSPQWVAGRFPEKLALRLQGPTTDQWLQFSDEGSEAFNFPGSFTIAMWVRLQPFTAEYQCLASKGDNGWRLSQYKRESSLHFAINEPDRVRDDPEIPPWAHVNGTTPVDDQQWHFIAAVFDAEGDEKTLSLYVDGQLDSQPVISEHSSAPNDDRVTIGANSWNVDSEEQQRQRNRRFIRPPRHIEGDIDEVIIMTRPLESSRIKHLYEAGKPAETTN